MPLFWTLILVGFLLVHSIIGLIAVMQVRRFWSLSRKTRFFTWAYLLATALLDTLIVLMFIRIVFAPA